MAITTHLILIILFYSVSTVIVNGSEVNVSSIDQTNNFLQFRAPPYISKPDHFNFITDAVESLPLPKESKTLTNVSARLNSKLSSMVNRLDAIKSLPLVGNYVSIVKIRDHKSVIGNGEEDWAVKINRYLRSHSIRLRLPEELTKSADPLMEDRAFDVKLEELATLNTGEGRGRIKKLILPIVVLLVVKFILLLPVFLSGIALVSLNGLWAGVTALFVATALGLRALFVRDTPGYAPRFSLVPPSFPPSFPASFHAGFQPQYLATDSVQVHADLVPVWSRNGVQGDGPYRSYPPVSAQ